MRVWALTGAALVFTALNLVLLAANADAVSVSGLGSPPADALAMAGSASAYADYGLVTGVA